MTTRFPRDVLAKAFPGQPRMLAAFEDLITSFETAVDTLEEAASTASGAAGSAQAALDRADGRQPLSDLLTAIAALPAEPGAIEQTGAGVVAIRPIDAADTKSLLTRQVADSRYLGSGTATTVPATSTSTGRAGQIAYSASFFYICVAANTWRRVAIASW